MAHSDENNTNIKLLMEAEEKAKKVVDNAKAEKVQKLAQAQQDARQRVAEMRAAKDEEFRQYQASHTSDLDEQTHGLSADTDKRIEVINTNVAENMDAPIQFLSDGVLRV